MLNFILQMLLLELAVLALLSKDNSILEAKEKSYDYFALADVNCRLCVKLDGEFHCFGTLDELRSLVSNTEGKDGDEEDGNDGQAENEEEAESEEEQDESVAGVDD